MPALSRVGDVCSGHADFPPRPSTAGSPNVFINGNAATRVGDPYAVHCDDDGHCHESVICSGSSTIFINGIAAARIGDDVCCGSVIAEGSSNSFGG